MGGVGGGGIKATAPLNFQRAPSEVKDNFLQLVVPFLQAREEVQVKVLVRERMEKRCDIRVLVEDMRAVHSKEGKKVAQWRSTG